MINKVITCIVRWININHLHLTQIRLLKEFEHFEVVTLDIKVLGIVPIYTILLYGTQCLLGRTQNLCTSSLLAYPVELIRFGGILHGIITKELTKHVKVNYTFYPPWVSATSVKHEGAI